MQEEWGWKYSLYGTIATTTNTITDLVWDHYEFYKEASKSYGREVIMVIIDRLSKHAHFLAVAHPYTTKDVSQLFMDNIYKLHGLQRTIVSDRDRIFTSQFW